jgi:tetratricopeptide (TPR) repeat protein
MTESDEIRALRIELGRQMAARRTAAGYSQTALAPLTGYSRSTVAGVEVGRQHVQRDFWERCDAALGSGTFFAVQFDLLVSKIEQRKRDSARALQDAREVRVQVWRRTTDANAPDRGSYDHSPLIGLLDGLSTLHWPTTNNRMTADATLPLPGGMTLAQTTAMLLSLFLDLDNRLGGNTLYAPLNLFVRQLSRTVKADGDDSALESLGILAQMAGWLALDSNEHSAARRHFNVAVYAAHQADTPSLAASSLAYLSLQDTYRDRPKSALSLAQTAAETSRGSTSPAVRTMLATRLARAHARQNDEAGCRRALDEAHHRFAEVGTTPEPPWISYVDAIELAAQEGACYLDLGLAAEAQSSLNRALDLLSAAGTQRVRDRVHYLSRLAKTHLLGFDVDQACAVATDAVQVGRSIRSARVLERLEEFNSALRPFAEARSVQAFRVQLADA